MKAKHLQGKKAMKKLLFVSVICFIFMGGEVLGGYLSNSLAIMTDAAHMLSDVAGFMISYFAIYMGGRPSSF
jgi:zinc transporter 2